MSDEPLNELIELPAGSMGHKPGCAFKPEEMHRTPIDCVTVEDLWATLEIRSQMLESRDAEIMKLKSLLYDYEHDSD